jgi:ABC-type microcin C transport system permease subunit YejB
LLVVDIDLHIAIAGGVYVFHGEVEFDVWIQAFILLEYVVGSVPSILNACALLMKFGQSNMFSLEDIKIFS